MKIYKKKFTHRRTEPCKLCQKDICTDIDNYTVMIDYLSDTQIALAFYHTKCLIDLITGKSKILEQNFKAKLSEFVKSMFAKSGIQNYQVNLDALTK